jgi:hypothetical protein
VKRSLVVIFLLLGLVLAAFLWQRWYFGRVVAEAHYDSPDGFRSVTYLVREYPTSPLLIASDMCLYRCEVRWRHRLDAAATFSWDSFTADHCSIQTSSHDKATFIIGLYNIDYTDMRPFGYRWDGPNRIPPK